MKIRKILNGFGDPSFEKGRVLVGKDYATYEYSFEEDECHFLIKSFDNLWHTIYKDYMIAQNESAFWDAKSEGNHIRIIRFSEEQPFIEYKYNILVHDLHLYDDFFLSSYTQNNKEIYLPFNPFTKEKKWEISFNINDRTRVLEWNEYFFVLLVNKTKLLYHSSQTGEALWSFDVSDYLMKDIPLYDDGEPIYEPELENVLYNPVYKLVLVQLNPNKLLALDADTGALRWLAPILPNSDWLVDKNTGNIYLMAATDYLDTYLEDDGRTRQVRRYTCIYQHIEGSTGETLLQRDLKEVIGSKHENGVDRALDYHHFGGYKGDSLYLSLFGDGELHKINKHTGELEESYIHDRNFESAPIIHQNRLFLTDPTADDKTRLLVFEI